MSKCSIIQGRLLHNFSFADKYGLLTKCEVKMVDIDSVSIHKLAKKERGQYQAISTEQAWSIKDLLCGFRGNFFLRDI